ncbi:MAG: UpxY family transcription antiterminator [Flavobacteriaceae bacterium]|nr:UpxY family transcription antiterminator [Flavobacteriaceae bacterium]
MQWFVIYVKPRAEKKVVQELEKLGITVFCPMITEVRQWSDRKKKVEVPLINSYVFVQLKEKEREIVFQVPYVVRYLFWLKKPAIVRDEEIRVLKETLSEVGVNAQVENLKPGDRLKVKSGPFAGKEGVVQELTKRRVQLILKDLGLKITLMKV